MTGIATPSKTVLLHFNLDALPEYVYLGYLRFKVQLFVPKPLRCFHCNRFGHIAAHCKAKAKCAKCGGGHSLDACTNDMKCPNCSGNHSASSKHCPKYLRESAVLKIKVSKRLSYADAVKEHQQLVRPGPSQLSGTAKAPPTSDYTAVYPALVRPTGFSGSPIDHRPLPHKNQRILSSAPEPSQPVLPSKPHEVGEKPNSPVNYERLPHDPNDLLSKSYYFMTFLAEVMKQVVTAQEREIKIDILSIIVTAAGNRLGVFLEPSQLQDLMNK